MFASIRGIRVRLWEIISNLGLCICQWVSCDWQEAEWKVRLCKMQTLTWGTMKIKKEMLTNLIISRNVLSIMLHLSHIITYLCLCNTQVSKTKKKNFWYYAWNWHWNNPDSVSCCLTTPHNKTTWKKATKSQSWEQWCDWKQKIYPDGIHRGNAMGS